MSELNLYYNEETGDWRIQEEPYATIEIATEEDYNYIQKALKFYKEHAPADE